MLIGKGYFGLFLCLRDAEFQKVYLSSQGFLIEAVMENKNHSHRKVFMKNFIGNVPVMDGGIIIHSLQWLVQKLETKDSNNRS